MKPSFDFFAVIIPSLNSIIEFLAKELIFSLKSLKTSHVATLNRIKKDKHGIHHPEITQIIQKVALGLVGGLY